jgi:hypothetical protein
VDPGKNNIIMCYEQGSAVYEDRKLLDRGKLFRYTQKQRNHETHVNSNRSKAEKRKAKRWCGDRFVAEWEEALSKFNSKTVNPQRFRQYMTLFLQCRQHTKAFYSKTIFRKERFNTYRLLQSTQARVVEHFKQRMGKPEDVVVAFGDGARNNVRGRAPGPSTAIRKLFQRNHFKVVDVSEAYTSKRCFACKDAKRGNNEACRQRLADNGKMYDVWGVRRCELCRTTWSRDYNACLNIAFIAQEHLSGRERPAYLQPETTVGQRKAHTARRGAT